jgi:hypothetical protein
MACAYLPSAYLLEKTRDQLGSNHCQIRSKTVYHDEEQS